MTYRQHLETALRLCDIPEDVLRATLQALQADPITLGWADGSLDNEADRYSSRMEGCWWRAKEICTLYLEAKAAAAPAPRTLEIEGVPSFPLGIHHQN